MTFRQRATFLFLLILTNLATAQNKIPVRQYLEEVETALTYNFSYKDQDLTQHVVTPFASKNMEAILNFLRDQTLFDYTLLEDRTIAVSKKKDVITICGKVVTSEILEAIEGAQINSPYQQLTTSANGTFTLQLKSPDELIEVTFNRLETKIIEGSILQKKPCTSVQLTPKVEYLNTVTLSNYFAKGISKNDNGSLTINYDDFDILPGLIEPDVLLTIQALPGIQSVNETVSFLNIRGGTNDQNLILWDGIKMYQNGHFFGLISAFNPFLTKQVTITKNGSSAAYGDGVSGVISMEGTASPNTQFTSEVGINLISADAFVDIPLGNLGSVQISGRKSINNLVQTPTYDAYFDKAFQNTEVTSTGDILPTSNEDFTFFDAGFRMVIQPTAKDFFRANVLILGNKLEFLENAIIDDLLQSRKSDLLQNNVSSGLFYKRTWNAELSSEIQVYGSAYELQSSNIDIVNSQQLFQENDVLESGLKFKTSYQISEKLIGHIGYQFNETGITNFERINNPFFERTDKQVLLTNSAFTEINYQPLSSIRINAGVRMNQFDKFDELLWEPRLSFNYRFLENFTFEILGELKSQTTSQIVDFQNDFLGVENRRWVLAKPDGIPIIKGQQLSAGLTFNRKGWLISAEPYIKKVAGITSQSQGFQDQFRDSKTQGSYTTYGVDFLLNKRFRKINTWLSYSYAKNQYRFDEFSPQEFHNNIDLRHTLTYGINYSISQFNISGGFNYHTGKPTTMLAAQDEVVDDELNYGAPNSANIKDYFRLDVSGTYRFKLGEKASGFIGASIWNLLDTENIINHFFRLNSNNEVEEIDEFALGFTPNVSFRVSF